MATTTDRRLVAKEVTESAHAQLLALCQALAAGEVDAAAWAVVADAVLGQVAAVVGTLALEDAADPLLRRLADTLPRSRASLPLYAAVLATRRWADLQVVPGLLIPPLSALDLTDWPGPQRAATPAELRANDGSDLYLELSTGTIYGTAPWEVLRPGAGRAACQADLAANRARLRRPVWRGVWSPAQAYQDGDVVRSRGPQGVIAPDAGEGPSYGQGDSIWGTLGAGQGAPHAAEVAIRHTAPRGWLLLGFDSPEVFAADPAWRQWWTALTRTHPA